MRSTRSAPTLATHHGLALLLAGGLAVTAAACSGTIGPRLSDDGQGQGRPGTGAEPGSPPPAGSDPRPPPGPPPPSGSCVPSVPWRTTSLTREQYINAAGDLLGLDVRKLVTLADVGGRKFSPGVSLTALQVEERLNTAEAIAAAAVAPAQLAQLLPCDPGGAGEAACVSKLIDHLGQRAFRRPLGAESTAALRKLFDAGKAAGGFATGVEWLLVGILQSPDFLYHLAPTPSGAVPGKVAGLDGYTLASRLSFFLWNSPPDDELRAAAASGALRTAAGVATQARRLLADPRSARARDDHYAGWLRLDDLAKIARTAPELTPQLVADLQRSAIAGVAEVFRNGGKVEDLLGSSTIFANEAIGKVYGLAVTGEELKPVAAPAGERRGVLTHPSLMALLANDDSSDPIRRGLFVEEELLCQTMPDPVDDVPDLPALKPGLSTRARLEMHRASPACSVCHQFFDPVGMALESYDSIGRFRKTDQGVPVDSSGTITQNLDIDGPFANGMELLAKLGTSTTVRDCMVKHWFEYAVSRHEDPGDACSLEPLRARFRKSGDLRELLASVAESDAFRFFLVPQE